MIYDSGVSSIDLPLCLPKSKSIVSQVFTLLLSLLLSQVIKLVYTKFDENRQDSFKRGQCQLIAAKRPPRRTAHSSAFAADAAGELDVLGHDGDALAVDGAEVGVLVESNEVSLAGLLQGHDGEPLEAQFLLEVLSNLTHKPLERQTAEEELSGLLVLADLAQGHGARPEAVGLLHPTSVRSSSLHGTRVHIRLTRASSGKGLPRRLTTG